MRFRLAGWVLAAGLVLIVSGGAAQATQNFSFDCMPGALSVPTGQFHQFLAPIAAVPPGADSVDVQFYSSYPNGWFSQWCQASNGICFIDSQPLRLSSGVQDAIQVDFFPVAGQPGMGWAQLTVRSRVDPLDVAQCTYTLYSGRPVVSASYVINCQDNIRRLASGTYVDFDMPMRNSAGTNDSLIVFMTTSLPAGWFSQFCQTSTGICFVDQGVLGMPPGVQDHLRVDFFMAGSTGYGVADLALHSAANPTVVTYCHYQVFLNMGTTGTPEAVAYVTQETRSWADPNPFSAETTLRLRTDQAGPADLSIFAADGRIVRNLAGLGTQPGVEQIRWDGRADDGSSVPSGVYFYRFRTSHGDSRGMVIRTR